MNKSEYTDTEEGLSRTKHSTSSEEQNEVEELLQTEPQDTDLAASFLQDHRNPLEPAPVPYQSLFLTLNMATQNQPINNGTQNNGTKELGINKPTPFAGEQMKVNSFIQECNIYLMVNQNIYSTEEAKITFILSYLTDKEALQWKEQYVDSITNATGAITFPPFAT